MIEADKLTKLYYSIGEVSEMFGVSASLIRFWETEFPSFKPKKDRRGDRRYMKKDILLLEKIYKLVKERGFTLEGARKEMSKPETEGHKELINKLQHIKKNLIQIRKEIKES